MLGVKVKNEKAWEVVFGAKSLKVKIFCAFCALHLFGIFGSCSVTL